MKEQIDITPHSKKFRMITLPFARLIASILLFLLGPAKVIGRYRVPKQGGVLILSNHISDIDPVLVQYACTRPIHFMAKSELFEMKIIGKLMRIFKAFPVKRGEPDRDALKRAAELLKMGEVVCVFPEGQLSEDGLLQPLKAGIALIIRMANVPVICVGLKDTDKIMPYGMTFPRPAFRIVQAEWGEVHTFDKGVKADEVVAWAEGQLRSLTDQDE